MSNAAALRAALVVDVDRRGGHGPARPADRCGRGPPVVDRAVRAGREVVVAHLADRAVDCHEHCADELRVAAPREGIDGDAVGVVDEVQARADQVGRACDQVGSVVRRRIEPVVQRREAATDVARAVAEVVCEADVPEVDWAGVAGLADAVEALGQRPRARAVVGEHVVEERRLREERPAVRAIALVQLGLQEEAVAGCREPGGRRLSGARHRRGSRDVVRDRVVGDHDVRRVVERDSAALVGRDVVRDRVVEDVDAVVVEPDRALQAVAGLAAAPPVDHQQPDRRRRRRWTGSPGSCSR